MYMRSMFVSQNELGVIFVNVKSKEGGEEIHSSYSRCPVALDIMVCVNSLPPLIQHHQRDLT